MANEEVPPEKVITIDGNKYNISELSENAKSQLQGMQVALNEIKRLDMEKALIETARNAYGAALADDLPEPLAND